MTSILLAIIVLGVLITVHELGHFLVAKAVGIKVHEFSIGMGPLIFQSTRGETKYSLRALPIGGFNRMAGEQPEDEDDPRGFDKKSVGARMAVISAGSIMNFLLGVVFFVIVFMLMGTPTQEPVIGRVLPGGPAAAAGLEAGDKIVTIDGQEVQTWTEVVNLIHQAPGRELELVVERKSPATLTVRVTPNLDEASGVGLIGIEQGFQKAGFFESIALGFQQAVTLVVLVLQFLVQMITGAAPADVAGPVGIVQMVGQAASFGLANLLSFAGMLTVQLGLFNLLPVPALDGSRMVFLAVEGIRGRKIDPEKENFVHMIGFALLMGLMLLVTYQDILRLFQGSN